MGGDLVSPLGPLPLGWRLAELRDIATKVGSGATPKGGESVYLEERSKFALVRSQNVHDRRFDDSSLAFISDSHARELRGAELQPGDLLLNITGDGVTFARACIVPQAILPACVNQHVSIIRLLPDVCLPGYLLAYLTHPEIKAYMESFNAGGSRRAITKGNIESFRVLIPPLAQQKKISDILGALDEKIELSRRMARTLEEMASAIFKSWFVDFDPVREVSEAVSSKFEDSDIGKIPAGWSVGCLGDYVEILRGLSYKGSGLADSGLPLHNLNSVLEGGGYKYGGIKYYRGEFRDRHTTVPGDIIVANTEQGHEFRLIGYPAIVPGNLGALGLFSHHLFRLRPLSGSFVRKGFLYFLLLSESFRERLIGYASGTTVNMLPGEGLSRAKFIVPPVGLMRSFEKIVSPFLEKIEICYAESGTSAQIRDSLVPKFFSGEFRV